LSSFQSFQFIFCPIFFVDKHCYNINLIGYMQNDLPKSCDYDII